MLAFAGKGAQFLIVIDYRNLFLYRKNSRNRTKQRKNKSVTYVKLSKNKGMFGGAF